MKISNTNKNTLQGILTQITPEINNPESSTNKQASIVQISDDIAIDTVDISEEGKQKANSLQSKFEEMRNRYGMLHEELKRAGDIATGMAEGYKVKIKCMQIAMRIMSGDKVPLADHRYLAERDSELYAKALSMRVEKKDPKEHDRLSEDEKAEDVGTVEDTAGDTVSDTTEPAETVTPPEPEASPDTSTPSE